MTTTMCGLGCALVLLAGCASDVWSKPGGRRADFARDSYTCTTTTRQQPSAPIYAPSASANGWVNGQMQGQALMNLANELSSQAIESKLYKDCMALRGWEKVPPAVAIQRKAAEAGCPTAYAVNESTRIITCKAPTQ